MFNVSVLIILSSLGFGELRLGFELQGQGVDAVAFTRWLWAVIKDVAEVGIAVTAQYFHAAHAHFRILLGFYVGARGGVPEAWPARTAVEFGVGLEERLPAVHAVVGTRSFGMQVLA